MKKFIAGAATTLALAAGPAAHAEAQNTHPTIEVSANPTNPDTSNEVSSTTDVPVGIPPGENPTILTTTTQGGESTTSTSEATSTTSEPMTTTSAPQANTTTSKPKIELGGGVTTIATTTVPVSAVGPGVSAGPEQGDSLPNTGTDPAPLIAIGGIAVATGTAAALSKNRKRG